MELNTFFTLAGVLVVINIAVAAVSPALFMASTVLSIVMLTVFKSEIK